MSWDPNIKVFMVKSSSFDAEKKPPCFTRLLLRPSRLQLGPGIFLMVFTMRKLGFNPSTPESKHEDLTILDILWYFMLVILMICSTYFNHQISPQRYQHPSFTEKRFEQGWLRGSWSSCGGIVNELITRFLQFGCWTLCFPSFWEDPSEKVEVMSYWYQLEF